MIEMLQKKLRDCGATAALVEVFGQFGLKLEAQPKDKMDRAIREAIPKDNPIASQPNLSFAASGRPRTLRIKLEIDTNPPPVSTEASTLVDFPADYEVRHQDLSSNFALTIHALLCQRYLKGRDWFDFSWYVANRVYPNLPWLRSALQQAGPWLGRHDLEIDGSWLTDALQSTIRAIDWAEAAADAERLLHQTEAKLLGLWSERFFHAKVDRLAKGAPA